MTRRTRKNRRKSLVLALATGVATLALAAPAAQAAPAEGTGAAVPTAPAALPEDSHLTEAAVPRDGGVVLRRSAPPAVAPNAPDAQAPVIRDTPQAGGSSDSVTWMVVGMGTATLVLLAAAATLLVMRERRTRMVLR